ncbi:MAG TPA: peptidylprolyl isomerase [Phycisphaerales bacterium]|nr:peptidylprolyl isomerase [Phycisphaerales bacterium]
MNMIPRFISTLLVGGLCLLVSCEGGSPSGGSATKPASQTPANGSTGAPAKQAAPAGGTAASAPEHAPATAPAVAAAPPPPPPAQPTYYVLMQTSMGGIVLELDHDHAPISVDNFLKYADEGFYTNTVFHRVIKTFMIQGGGFTTDRQPKTPTHSPIKNEWTNGLKNVRGSIAMARVGGDPNSASCQFFINVVDNPGLDTPQDDGAAYAVFGKVIVGMMVVDAIRDVPVQGQFAVDPPVINSVKRITKEQAMAMVQVPKTAPNPDAAPTSQPAATTHPG